LFLLGFLAQRAGSIRIATYGLEPHKKGAP